MKLEKGGKSVRIRLESPEDVWFWQRRFNVFDFLELFPSESISPPAPEGQTAPPATTKLTFITDAGFSFETDIVYGGFYLRNQSQGTRRWMTERDIVSGDTIEITAIDATHFHLRKTSA